MKPPQKETVLTPLTLYAEIKVKLKGRVKTAKEGADKSGGGDNKAKIFVHALVNANRLSNSAKLTASKTGGEDSGGDIRVQMSKESLTKIVGEVSSTGNVDFREPSTLTSIGTARLNRVAKAAGVSIWELREHFNLKESKGSTNGTKEKADTTSENDKMITIDKVPVRKFHFSASRLLVVVGTLRRNPIRSGAASRLAVY